jgi:hypothetical protein
LLFVISFSYAQNLANGQISVSGGYLPESGVLYFGEINQYRYVGDTPWFKGEIAYHPDLFAKRFGFGAYYGLAFPFYAFYDVVTMNEFGLNLQVRLNLTPRFQVIPKLFTGYRSYSGEAGEGFGLNFSTVFLYRTGSVNPFMEAGFFSQPAGGNEGTDITYSPLFEFGAGVSFDL